MHLAHSATTPPRLSLAEAQADGVDGGGACGDSVGGRGQGEIGGDSDARADWGVVPADPGTPESGEGDGAEGMRVGGRVGGDMGLVNGIDQLFNPTLRPQRTSTRDLARDVPGISGMTTEDEVGGRARAGVTGRDRA